MYLFFLSNAIDCFQLIDDFLFAFCRNFEPPQGRKQSLDDINLDQFLKIANYEDTVKELDIYYGIGNIYIR